MNKIKPTLAVHKFSSCNGCQLALLNLGESLLALPELVEIVHFAGAGSLDMRAQADIALVEGSISTPHDVERIRQIRKRSGFLIAIGACAINGGLQALSNFANRHEWIKAIYHRPDYIDSLKDVTAISEHVRVDLALPGCPVNAAQVMAALRELLSGIAPRKESETLCMECKRKAVVCTLVAKGEPCMGPVTMAGCGALCPSLGRGCYGCYGPASQVNGQSLTGRFAKLGLDRDGVLRRFRFITGNAPEFREVGEREMAAEKE